MADFDVNTITVQGAIAIASATAGDKLVIDGCDATTDVLTQAQAVQIATRPASHASTTDTIGLAGSTDNHVYAYASFIRGESTGGDVYSFLLYGHMESDATTVFVVAVASATAATHIPTSGDVTNRVEIQFELTFSATDEVVTVTDTSMYTTRGEFLILKNRTVTTHAEGQATVGENQTVYGSKDFKDAVDFNGIYTVQASRTEAQGGTDNTNTMYFSPKENLGEGPEFVAITKDNGTAITGSSASMFAGSLNMLSGGAGFTAEDNGDNTPTASMEASRGLSGASAGVDVSPTQVTLYTQAASGGARRTVMFNGSALEVGANVYAPSMVAEKFELLNASAFMEWDAQSSTIYFSQPITASSFKQEDGNVLIDDAGVYTDDLNPMSGSKIDVNGSIVPSSSNTYNLGSTGNEWNDIHCAGVACLSSIETNTIAKRGGTGSIELQSDIVPNTVNSVSLGSKRESFAKVYSSWICCNELHTPSGYGEIGLYNNIIPNTVVNLGSSGNRFSEIWAGYLNGRLPNARNSTGYLTIGSIAFVCVDYGSASSSQINFNNEFWKNNGGIIAIYPAMFNSDYSSGGSIFIYDNTDPYLDSYKFIALCSTYGSGRFRFLFAMLNQT